MGTQVPRIGDVIGTPLLPPASATAGVERVRGVLARLLRATAPPPIQILEGVLAALDQVALGALVALDLPDRLDRPTSVSALAAECRADEDVVARIVAYAAARNWVRVDRRGRVRATRLTRFLRRDHPGGWRAWVEFVGSDEMQSAMHRLALAPGLTSFEDANGASFFEWMAEHPDRHTVFDRAMSTGGFMHGYVLAASLDWSRVARVCDVGGGGGAVLRVLLERVPHLHGVLFDLPVVVDRADAHERLDVVGGDAFVGPPPGCDTYLFVNVIHDWNDEDAVRLLDAARIAGGDDARIVVVESVRRERPRDRLAVRSDLLMLAVAPGGRERSGHEIEDLAHRAKLDLATTTPLASTDTAYELVSSAT